MPTPENPCGPDDPILLSAVLQAIGSAIVVLDPAARVRLWNAGAEQLLGIASAEAVGRRFPELAIGWDWKALGALVPGFIIDQALRLDDVHLTRRDGSQAILAFSILPIAGGQDGCVWHGADVGERRSMESQLRHAQKMEAIGSLAAGIAHEINTPMQFIGDNTRFLSETFTGLGAALASIRSIAERADPAAVAEAERANDLAYLLDEAPKAIAQTLDGIQRVSLIVKAMKEFAHPGADEPVPTDLNHAIESTLTVSRNVWKYVADTVLCFAPDLPPVPVVPGGFNQAILNLVINAAHAIEDLVGGPRSNGSGGHPIAKGVITIRTQATGGNAVVEVSDSGCGIPAAIRDRIFEPFFTTKEPGRGTGQGLAIVRAEIVERLGGRVEVDSTPGKGSTFRLIIPLNPTTEVIRRRRPARGTA
jgi:PAS domain S-box-containing protein